MISNQTLVAPDGYEVALFPMPYLYMTQDEGGDYSHLGTYNIDCIGYNGSSVITNAPIYAPCTLKVLSYHGTYTGGNAVIFQSVNKVHLANGQLDYMCIMFMHDNNPPYTTTGATVQQGQVCYHTGTYGQVTGDHVHTCVGQGQNATFVQRPSGNYDLSNRIHYWDGVFVNDTTIIQGYGHNWRTWQGGSGGGGNNKKRFPWPVAWAHWPNYRLR